MSQAGTYNQGGGPTPPAGVAALQGDTGGPVSGNPVFVLGQPQAGLSVVFEGDSIDTLRLRLTDDNANTMLGNGTGNPSTTGFNNTTAGRFSGNALLAGSNNALYGIQSGVRLEGGINNVMIGSESGFSVVDGDYNIIVGDQSGNALGVNSSGNILIGNSGDSGDNNTMRLGTTGAVARQVNRTFVAGTLDVDLNTFRVVTMNDNEQIGTNILTAGAGIIITNGPPDGAITITATGGGGGGGGAENFPADVEFATAIGEVLNIFGDPNITTYGSTNTIQVTLNQTITISGHYITTGGHIELPPTNFATNAGYIELAGLPILHQQNSSSNIFVGGNNAENTTGVNNTAIGYLAANALLLSGNNFFGGTQSGAALTNAFFNTFLGAQSGFNLLTGSRNLLLGYQSGISYTTNESNNILLANDGVIAESNTMRLGTTGAGAGQVNRAFVAGVSGVNVGATATVATVAADGQLGTANIVAGAGITVTPGANTITIAAAGGGGAYSEGVWNPILSFNGQTVAPTYLVSAASTFYVKVGNVVTVNSSIVMTNQGTSPGTARFVIGGFPFDTNGLIAYVTFYIQAFSGSVGTFISNAILSGTDTSTASIQAVKVAGVNSTVFNLTAANFPNTQGPYTIRINCTYIVGF